MKLIKKEKSHLWSGNWKYNIKQEHRVNDRGDWISLVDNAQVTLRKYTL